jgi:cyclopropane fatty-acyl-phospholipid synthase-like methyltransferase
LSSKPPFQQHLGKPEEYWNRAGELSYSEAMYGSADVERHVRPRLWNIAAQIADEIGVPQNGRVLDCGCGDGAFANEVLAAKYHEIHGYDLAPSAIERARSTAAGPHMTFVNADLLTLDYDKMPRFDGTFLIGLLHHIKAETPQLLRSLAGITDKMVVLEPNGDHLARKLLEFTPSYRAAGEDSFRTREIRKTFAANGWQMASYRRLNLFPNFTPGPIYRLLAPLEPYVERSAFWNKLCIVNMLGLVRKPGG